MAFMSAFDLSKKSSTSAKNKSFSFSSLKSSAASIKSHQQGLPFPRQFSSRAGSNSDMGNAVCRWW